MWASRQLLRLPLLLLLDLTGCTRLVLDLDGALISPHLSTSTQLTMHPNSVGLSLLQSAQEEFSRGQYNQSRLLAEASAQLFSPGAPSHSQALALGASCCSNIGLALYNAGDKSAARGLLEQAVSLTPRMARPRLMLAMAMRELGADALDTGYSPVVDLPAVRESLQHLRIAEANLRPSDPSWVSTTFPQPVTVPQVRPTVLLQQAAALRTIGYHSDCAADLQAAASTYRRAAQESAGAVESRRFEASATYDAQLIEQRLAQHEGSRRCQSEPSQVVWSRCSASAQSSGELRGTGARLWSFESTISANGRLEALLFAEDQTVIPQLLQVYQSGGDIC